MSEVPLSVLAEVNPSLNIPSGLAADDQVSFIPMGDVSESGEWVTEQTRTLRSVSSGFTAFAEGDVLVAKITPCLENGKGAHARGLTGSIGFGSTEFHVLRARTGTDARFLFHISKSRRFRRAAEAQMVGSAGQQRVQRQFFDEFFVEDFPVEVQAEIAQILDTLDTAIRETGAIVAKLKAVKQGLLHDLLTRGIDANGELRPPQSEVPHLYKQSPLGWIPKEWECVRLAEKLAVLGGKRLPAGHRYADHPTGFKYLRVTDFHKRVYVLGDLENLHERTFKALERYEIKPEQLYISIAGSLGYVGTHRLAGTEGVRTVLTENAARLVPLCELEPDFVSAYMSSEMVQSQVTSEKGTGGGVPKLALFRIEQFWLAWPRGGEQHFIAERLQTVDERISDELQMLRKLRLQKAGLVDDLLTGRVRVTPLLESAEAATA